MNDAKVGHRDGTDGLPAGRDRSQLCVHFGLNRSYRIGEIGEEVVVEDARDAQQQTRIEALLLKNTVYISPIAGQMPGQPAYAVLLPAQLGFDQSSYRDMFHAVSNRNPASGVASHTIRKCEARSSI